ncbi:MAG TPA: ribonuclease H-like domain-containing protein [Rhodanobacteraceae bacterium]
MTTLADRIRGIVAPAAPRPPAAIPDPQPPSRDPLAAALVELGGASSDGTVVIERRWNPAARYGSETIGDAAHRLNVAADNAPLIAGSDATAPFVFFDLETTGLSGGAGTHAFLVGCGSFDQDGGFVTRQFLMLQYAAEPSMLRTVAGELARAGAIVSFNGKSFDAPVLETRYAFHRMAWVGAQLPHIDVLHPARQFWGSPKGLRYGGQVLSYERGEDGTVAQAFRPGSAEGSCTLQALERKVVGCRTRTGDVPGFEIPARYFAFVRSGDPRPLVPVLEHNRRDLLTLALLTSRLLHLARAGADLAGSAAEALALGKLYVRAGQNGRASDAFTRAVEMSRAPAGAYDPVRIDAVRALAVLCRRGRQFDQAAAWWQALMNTRGCPPAILCEAAEALAIHHEHRVRDLDAARTFALKSLDADTKPSWKRAVDYRLARLERKAGRGARLSFGPLG